MSELSSSRHVAYDQVRTMLDFMAQHVDFATGSLRSLEARHTSKKLWGELTLMLNSCRGGTRKSMDGWSKYWSDFKNKLKNKVRILNKRKRLGSTEKGVRPLTKLEKRAVVILGPYFEKKISEVTIAGYREEIDLPEVKIESDQERCSGPSEISPERRGEDEADSDFDDDSDNNSNEPLINTLYPKWLIEVERKRADAELARAKAEESRACVAAQSAQAAVTQAEALRALSRAATMQAEAVARIAAILDRVPLQGLMNI